MSDLPFWFFETVDLPPEQDFLQGQETDRACVLAFLRALQSAGIDPDNIRKGERLTFDIESTRDGRTRASNVRRSG
jgi:hypothetical protein